MFASVPFARAYRHNTVRTDFHFKDGFQLSLPGQASSGRLAGPGRRLAPPIGRLAPAIGGLADVPLPELGLGLLLHALHAGLLHAADSCMLARHIST